VGQWHCVYTCTHDMHNEHNGLGRLVLCVVLIEVCVVEGDKVRSG